MRKKYNREFFACLDYYQKGRNFYLHITGKASIAETVPEFADAQIAGNNNILIKCKITKAEYFEHEEQYKLSARERLVKYLSKLFYSNSHKIFYFSGVA